MRNDNRLPRVLHVLLHLDEMEEPATSALIGKMLHTNSSVVRRTMAGLRDAGFVSSSKGHGGGWVLEKSLSEITLADIYSALGTPSLFALGTPDDEPSCLMEQAANAATTKALNRAAHVFSEEISSTTMADLAEDFSKRLEQYERNTTI